MNIESLIWFCLGLSIGASAMGDRGKGEGKLTALLHRWRVAWMQRYASKTAASRYITAFGIIATVVLLVAVGATGIYLMGYWSVRC